MFDALPVESINKWQYCGNKLNDSITESELEKNLA